MCSFFSVFLSLLPSFLDGDAVNGGNDDDAGSVPWHCDA